MTASLAWEQTDWLDEATAWIDERVERTGEVELRLARPWSAIVRVPTAGGDVWFKENGPPSVYGYEPGSRDVERLRDLYLEPFNAFAPVAELRDMFADGYLLFPVSRADSWRRTLEDAPEPEEFGDRVNAWLEILAEIADGTTTLGGA